MPVSPPYLTFRILQPLQNKASPRNTSENVFSFVSWKHWWEEKLLCVLCKKPFNVWSLSALFCSFTFPEVSPCKRNSPFHRRAENLRQWRGGSLGKGQSTRYIEKHSSNTKGLRKASRCAWVGPRHTWRNSSFGAWMAAGFAGWCFLLSSCYKGIHLIQLTMQGDTTKPKHWGMIQKVCVHSENLKEKSDEGLWKLQKLGEWRVDQDSGVWL